MIHELVDPSLLGLLFVAVVVVLTVAAVRGVVPGSRGSKRAR